MLKSSRNKSKGGYFLWEEAAEAEALITAHIIRAVIHIRAVLPDRPTDHPGLLTGHPDHLTDRLIRIIREVRITREAIPVLAPVPAEAVADVLGFSVSY